MRRAYSSIGEDRLAGIAEPRAGLREHGQRPVALLAALPPVREAGRVREDHPRRDPEALRLRREGSRIRNGDVEVEPALLGELQDGRREDGLRHRGGLEERLVRDGRLRPRVGDAPGPQPRDLPVPDDGDRDARDVELAHQERREPLDRRERRVPGRGAEPSRRVQPFERERGAPSHVLVGVAQGLAQRGENGRRRDAGRAEGVHGAPAHVRVLVGKHADERRRRGGGRHAELPERDRCARADGVGRGAERLRERGNALLPDAGERRGRRARDERVGVRERGHEHVDRSGTGAPERDGGALANRRVGVGEGRKGLLRRNPGRARNGRGRDGEGANEQKDRIAGRTLHARSSGRSTAKRIGRPPVWRKTTGTAGSRAPERASAKRAAIDLPV